MRILLHRRAFYRTIGAVYTTVPFFGPDHISAIGTLVKILTGIRGHHLLLLMPAYRAGDLAGIDYSLF